MELQLLHLSQSTLFWNMCEADIYFHSILTLVVDGGAWSESHPRHLTPLRVPIEHEAGWAPEPGFIL